MTRAGGLGGSLFLIALGAILYWAVSVDTEGFNLNTIGLILMIVGVVGLLLTFVTNMSANEAAGKQGTDVTVVEKRDD